MAMGWVDQCVGLGRVRSNMIHSQTALVNISCNVQPRVAYFLIPITVGERLLSGQPYHYTDARSRLPPKTVKAMELIRWAVRGSLLNMDD